MPADEPPASDGVSRADQDLQAIYEHRFEGRSEDRTVLWDTLVEAYFQRFVGPDDTVLDLAAGHCEFLSAIRCGRKIAIDLNPAIGELAPPGTEVHRCASTDLPAALDGQVDVVWVSNFFEHLPDADALVETLRACRRVLRPHGRLLVLQPNIRLVKGRYWDMLDHSLPVTEKRMAEAFDLSGFEIELMKVRFLPYTTDSALPISPLLIRAYLKFPPAWLLLGKQTFVVARPATG